MFKFLKKLFGNKPFKNGRRLTLAYVLTLSQAKRRKLGGEYIKLAAISSLLDNSFVTKVSINRELNHMFGENIFFYELLVTELNEVEQMTDFQEFLDGVISVVVNL